MKRFLLYISTLLALTACLDENMLSTHKKDVKGDVQIVCRIPQFSEVDVATKGDKSSKESQVYNMLMFICDNDGNIIADPQFEEGSKPVFSIIRSDLGGGEKSNAQIVVLANVTDKVKSKLITPGGQMGWSSKVADLNAIKSVSFDGCGIDIPNTGIPMLGIKVLNLEVPALGAEDPLAGSVIEVPLNCLYAKIVFNISVVPNQLVDGKTQSFQLVDWTVCNVPEQVAIGAPAGDAETEYANSTMIQPITRNNATKSVVNQSTGNDKLSFSFYMPEHKINPNQGITYPWGSDPDGVYNEYRQYLKPDFVRKENEQHVQVEEKKATYVKINGYYTDHNGEKRKVQYDIYLGGNNYDNFHILRDHQYNNNIVIKGIKNSSTAVGSWVTYDHRVNVEQKQFNFNLQRETLLDCHWEIRPIRIKFNQVEGIQSGYKLKVSLKDPSQTWLRMEMPDDPTGAAYCVNPENGQPLQPTDLAYGKRRYFTTDLVTNSLNGNTEYTITYDGNPEKEYTIWVYADEYYDKAAADASAPNPSMRSTAITCQLLDGNDVEIISQDYIFQQYNVFKVSNNGHDYYIEYFEEYLYNFDSKEQYGNTTDGMAWGLMDKEISCTFPSFQNITDKNIPGGHQTRLNNLLENSKPYYDFYINTTESGTTTAYPYSGNRFTQELTTVAGIGALATNEVANSAVEYCYNKNKRNYDGSIVAVNWYMPSIDELEEIVKGGYASFDVFQDKLYWASQPAYNKGIYNGTYRQGNDRSFSGSLYNDNIQYARATKVDNNFNSVSSGTEKNAEIVFLVQDSSDNVIDKNTPTDKIYIHTNYIEGARHDDGYCKRDEIHRVRTVYTANPTLIDNADRDKWAAKRDQNN